MINLERVFSRDDGLTPEVQDPRGSMIDDIPFTTNGIVKLLKDLNSEKASGSDKISRAGIKIKILFHEKLDNKVLFCARSAIMITM